MRPRGVHTALGRPTRGAALEEGLWATAAWGLGLPHQAEGRAAKTMAQGGHRTVARISPLILLHLTFPGSQEGESGTLRRRSSRLALNLKGGKTLSLTLRITKGKREDI